MFGPGTCRTDFRSRNQQLLQVNKKMPSRRKAVRFEPAQSKVPVRTRIHVPTSLITSEDWEITQWES